MAAPARFSFDLVPQAARNVPCGSGQTLLLSLKLGSKRAEAQAIPGETQAVEWNDEILRVVASLKGGESHKRFAPKLSHVGLKVYSAKQKLLHRYSLKLDLSAFAKAGADSERAEKLVLIDAATGRQVELHAVIRSKVLPELPRLTDEPALADLSDAESDASVDLDCEDDDMALGMAAAAGAALLGGSAASAAADDGDAPAQKDPEPEALAALRAELAASRQLLSNANVLAEEYKQAAQKIAAAAEEKEAKRRAAFEEEVAAAKAAAHAARSDSEALAAALAAAESKLADAARNQTGFGFHTPSRKAASRLALAGCGGSSTPSPSGGGGPLARGELAEGVTPMRRWAATAAPAPRPRRAAGKAAEPQQPPKAADAAGEAATPARAAECGEEAGAPGAVWTVRRKDVEDDMAADLVCFQMEQLLREKAQMSNEIASLMRENRALADRCDLLENSMGDRAELMEELTLARDQAAEEVVAVAEALAGARSEAASARRRAEAAEEARALLQEQLTAERAAAAATEMSLTQALILARTATAQAEFERDRASLEGRARKQEAVRQRQRNAVLAREVTRQEVEIALLVRENALQRGGAGGQLRAFGSGVAETAAGKMEQLSGMWGMGKKRGPLAPRN